MRGEERERVVAPVVAHAALLSRGLGDELVDGEQFDRGDAERTQVLDRGRMAEARVRAALLLGDVGMGPGEPAHVQFVDHRVVPRDIRAMVVVPVELVVDHGAARHARRGVFAVIGVSGRMIGEIAHDRLGIGICQQFCGIVEMAACRVERAVDAVAVELSGADSGQVAVPDLIGAIEQRNPRFRAGVVEQADRHRGRAR